MLIAITATDKSLQAEVDPRFGRAAYYLIVDTTSGEITALDNSDGINAANGAGTGAVQRLSEAGVQKLYTGRIGPKAAAALEQAAITCYENISGTVQTVLEQLEAGDAPAPDESLRETQVPSPPQHGPEILPGAGRGQGRGRGMGRGRGLGLGGGRGACFSATPATPTRPQSETFEKERVPDSKYRLIN